MGGAPKAHEIGGRPPPPPGLVIGAGGGALGYFASDSLWGDDIERSIREGLGEYGCTGQLPYGAGVQTFMGELDRGVYGYYSMEPGPDGEITSVWMPPDPRYAAYRGALDRHRSGESGGCQTCHDINYAWQQTAELYGDPTPDRGTSPFGSASPLWEAPGQADHGPLLMDDPTPALWESIRQPDLTPEERAAIIEYLDEVDADQAE